MDQKELAYKLKKALGSYFDDATDESILRLTEGTFLRARIELGIEMNQFWRAVIGKKDNGNKI